MIQINRRIGRAALRMLVLFSVLMVAIGLSISRPNPFDRTTVTDSPAVDTNAMLGDVRFLSETLTSRSSDRPDQLNLAADYLRAQLADAGATVEQQRFSVAGREYSNVIGHFGPDTDAITVVGAHYDAYGGFPGADDNASGVAGMLERARLLSRIELRERVSLIAYSLEEPPHYASDSMGSHIHAQSLTGKKVRLMIALEMIGYYSDRPDSQSYPSPVFGLLYPRRGNFIAVVDQYWSNHAVGLKSAINRHTSLPAYSINAPAALPGIDYSDHRSYWAAGYRAVMITDTAYYRNAAYHTADDTADRLDYERMAEVVRGVYHYLVETDASHTH